MMTWFTQLSFIPFYSEKKTHTRISSKHEFGQLKISFQLTKVRKMTLFPFSIV